MNPTQPEKIPTNPGMAPAIGFEMENGEDFVYSFVDATAELLSEAHEDVINHRSFIELAKSGLLLSPLIASIDQGENNFVRTTCTMQVNHPKFLPNGVFEYLHSGGNTIEEALTKGLTNWMELDLPALLEIPSQDPQLMHFIIEMPEGQKRRVLFGPMIIGSAPPKELAVEANGHPTCDCCMFTNNINSFDALLKANETYCIRLYAMHTPDGANSSDCRINGEDYEPGFASLRDYAASWNTSGFEYRKQYVIIHSV